MATRRPHENPDIEATISAVYDDQGKTIRSYQDAADFLGISKNTLASRLRRANVSALSAVPYEKYVPANVDPEHMHDREYLMLRALAEEEAGQHLSDKRKKELDRFTAKSSGLIVVYDADYGFYWRKRRVGESSWLTYED